MHFCLTANEPWLRIPDAQNEIATWGNIEITKKNP